MNILKKWRLEQRKWLLTLGINTLSKNQLVFSNQKNEYLQLSKPRKWLEVIIKQNNLKRITIHGLRHTHASLLLEAGANIKDVQERLGHSSIQITMDLYIHITDKRKEKQQRNSQNISVFKQNVFKDVFKQKQRRKHCKQMPVYQCFRLCYEMLYKEGTGFEPARRY